MASTNVKYSLKVQIDQSKVVQFSKQNYKFCFASGVAGDENADPSFNIVADTQGKNPSLQYFPELVSMLRGLRNGYGPDG